MNGLDIARQRIAEEAEARTGVLDLGRLGLSRLPDELFELIHLRGLNLGSAFDFEDNEYVEAASDITENLIHQDLARLIELSGLRALFLIGMPISDLVPIHLLRQLEVLKCSRTPVRDLRPLQGLTTLQTLDCSSTKVNDLGPLQGLAALQTLDCSSTKVNDLGPLQGLTALQYLDCSEMWGCDDLRPLAGLAALQHLYCAYARFNDLGPLAGLKALQSLDCTWCRSVRDLGPLAGLTDLQYLNCSDTQVRDLRPLTALQYLNCSKSLVRDLGPLAGLTSLHHLECSCRQISDLGPLAGLTALRHLDCSYTKVSDLRPLAGLTALEHLNIRGNHFTSVAPGFWTNAALITVLAHETELQGFPDELFSQEYDDNCLPAIRAHVADLGNAPVPLNQVKLMVIGNGRIGKTQICNRLRDLPYDDKADSTHGITVTEAPIPGDDGTFAIWDFGGQDIYHGTHALFLKSRAVFLLVWTPSSDDAAEHEHDGLYFRNQPLSWWLDYVKRFGSEQSPLIVVQNQLDKDHDRGDHSAVVPLRDTLTFCRSLAYSAATDEGRDVLNAYLKGATMRFNPPLIGRGRLRVMERLIEMRETDAAMSTDERHHRTVPLAEFESICDEEGNVSDNRQLLGFLHNAGVVFWREGLFEDRIVLDQAWVLEAIYTVFNRKKCLQQLHAHAGRFTRSELGWMVWNELYSPEEQDLFVTFMRSCRICFEITCGSDDVESTYIAPDLLPENWSQLERAERWGEEPAEHERSFVYESLPPALLRNLICRIGERAGIRCEYWRNGFYGFEVETASRVLLEQEIQDDWRGEIRVQTRGGIAQQLLNRMINVLRKEEQRLGLTGTELSETPTESVTDAEAMSFGAAPDRHRMFYVSYAWADRDDVLEDSRERIVDEFCDAASEQGIKIHRDRYEMTIGNRISLFMNQLERADRVIVVLSDKYLRSPFCMHELHGIWRQSRSEGERFKKRVRVYTENDALIWTMEGRADYAVHWKLAYEKINSMVQSHGINVLGDQDKLLLGLMQKFAFEIGNILGELTNVLQPRSLSELVTYSFNDEDFDDNLN